MWFKDLHFYLIDLVRSKKHLMHRTEKFFIQESIYGFEIPAKEIQMVIKDQSSEIVIVTSFSKDISTRLSASHSPVHGPGF